VHSFRLLSAAASVAVEARLAASAWSGYIWALVVALHTQAAAGDARALGVVLLPEDLLSLGKCSFDKSSSIGCRRCGAGLVGLLTVAWSSFHSITACDTAGDFLVVLAGINGARLCARSVLRQTTGMQIKLLAFWVLLALRAADWYPLRVGAVCGLDHTMDGSRAGGVAGALLSAVLHTLSEIALLALE